MEIENRDKHEDEMFAAFLALWLAQRRVFESGSVGLDFWQNKENEDRDLLLYWLGALFVLSARQHGATREQAAQGARVWGLGHAVTVISRMRRHTERLSSGRNPAETIFGEERLKRFVTTETTSAQAAGSDFAKEVNGNLSGEDLWFAANPVERRCPYCGRLHLKPRSQWVQIYYSKILPNNPELALYGVPDRPPVHPNCNCFILYRGESSDDGN